MAIVEDVNGVGVGVGSNIGGGDGSKSGGDVGGTYLRLTPVLPLR